MNFLASAELNEEVVLGNLDYAYFVWTGIVFLVGLAMFRKGTIHYGEEQPSELQSSSQAVYGFFGLISFFVYVSVIPGTLIPSLKILFTEGDTAIYLAQLIGQILGAITLVAFAYLCPGSLRFAHSARLSEVPPLPVQTFYDDVKSGWDSLEFKTLWQKFFSL